MLTLPKVFLAVSLIIAFNIRISHITFLWKRLLTLETIPIHKSIPTAINDTTMYHDYYHDRYYHE